MPAAHHSTEAQYSALLVTSRTTDGDDSRDDDEPDNPAALALRDEENELLREMEESEREEEALRAKIMTIDDLRRTRAEPYESKLKDLTERRKTVCYRLEQLHILEEAPEQIPPGPTSMRWVESNWFHTLCMLVITLNMVEMFQSMRRALGALAPYSGKFDVAFLVFYSFELFVRAVYHQRNFLVGRPSVVCWNYMDAIIVGAGSLELIGSLLSGGGSKSHFSALRMLRLLRLFRVVRILKLLKFFIESDLAWIEGPFFESCIGFVIGINALVMWLELDFVWKGWNILEHIFLVIYTFELTIKIKVHGSGTFYHVEKNHSHTNLAPEEKNSLHIWNIMDLVIVIAGMLDLWMLPLYALIFYSVTGQEVHHEAGGIIVMLRMMRLIRIFRLVRLIRNIKPLYNLLMGVAESMAGMFWVFILALVVLYALAIVFTSFVGKGYLWAGSMASAPEEAEEAFGSVPQSMYMLFKLMNDDQSAVESIVTTPGGRGLFVLAMVVSNWALLAILTSVMSDNMIGASSRTQAEDAAEFTRKLEEKARRQLMFLFEEVDTDKSGLINEKEWKNMMHHPEKSCEVATAAGVSIEELDSFFSCLCENVQQREGRHSEAKLVMSYLELIEALKERTSVADKRSQLHILKRLKSMDRRLETRLDLLLDAVSMVNDEAARTVTAGQHRGHDIRAADVLGISD